jgi:Tfp pilus assembly PilM family ATPase
MARAIGLDIGARFVKVAELVGGPRSFKIQRVAVREIPQTAPLRNEDTETDLSEDLVIAENGDKEETHEPDEPTRAEVVSGVVRDIFKSLHLAAEDVCASFDSGATVFRPITVPFLEDDQIRKVVRFEAENHLHSYAIDDVVVNWIKTGETRDGSQLTIFASPKQQLAEHIALMRMARIDPASVDLDATALYTALEAAGIFEANPNCVVIEVGASATKIMLLEGGRLRALRAFRLGVGSLAEQVSKDLGVAATEAQDRTMRPAGPARDDLFVPASELEPAGAESEKSLAQIESDVVVDRRSEFVAKLHREVNRSLMTIRTETSPDKILLLGGGALVPDMAEPLGERLGLPVERVDLLEHMDCKDPGPDPAFTGAAIGTAVGCGLRMLGRNPLNIELLQDEFSPRNTFEVVRTTLATAITLLFLVIGIWTYSLKDQLRAEKTKYNDKAAVVELMTYKADLAYQKGIEHETEKNADTKTRRWLKQVLPRDDTRIMQMRNRLIQRHRFLQSELGLRSDIPRLPSAVKVMFEIYKAFSSVPRERLGTFFQINELVIQERRASLYLISDDRTGTVFDLARQLLSNSPYLKDRALEPRQVVDVGSETTLKDGKKRVIFTLRFREE